MLHSSGRSSFVLHEGATLLDLREKVHNSPGITEKQQKLAFDANGLTPILGADTAPLSSVGRGHGSVIFLSSHASSDTSGQLTRCCKASQRSQPT